VKVSNVMVHPVVDLKRVLSDLERDVLRKVLFEGVQGIDPFHHRRWVRQMSRLLKSEPGEVTEFNCMRTRSLPFHQRHMAIEGKVFKHQDKFPPTKAGLRSFRNWLKVGASLVRLEIHGNEPKWLPGSVSFEELSDDEMREFHEAAMDYMRSPYALKQLWPDVRSSKRAEMFETVINAKDEEER
jgi:hypothetical protein